MTDGKNLERMHSILETYDPDWKERQDLAHRQFDQTSKELRAARAAEDVEAIERLSGQQKHCLDEIHAAHHAQFRTAEDYKAWQLEMLEEEASGFNKFLILPELPENATVSEITELANRVRESLREQDYPTLPVGQPEGLNAFQAELSGNARRTTFYLAYTGFFGSPSEARCTIEQTQDEAFVCFHHIPNGRGTSPTNAVEILATGVKQVFLPNQSPEQIKFYLHVPASVAGHFGESFSHVDMDWTGENYEHPGWNHFDQIPRAIRDAEAKPYEEPPLPPPGNSISSNSSSRPRLQFGLIRGLLTRFTRE